MKLNLFVLLVVLHSIVDLPSLVSEDLSSFVNRKVEEVRRIPLGAAREAWFRQERHSLLNTYRAAPNRPRNYENNVNEIIEQIRRGEERLSKAESGTVDNASLSIFNMHRAHMMPWGR
jgi:hypothetical protein